MITNAKFEKNPVKYWRIKLTNKIEDYIAKIHKIGQFREDDAKLRKILINNLKS